MTCQDHKDLMMAYLDDELDDEQRRAFEAHLASCGDCAKDLEEFKKLKQITDGVQLVEPEDRIWDEYWSRIYNRIERGTGWILFSVAAIALLIYGGFELIETVIENRTVGVLARVGLVTLVAGGAILFVSVLRERIYFWSRDRYKDVRR
jgi:predicted anti-sigma-YlaC factor YlaD